MAAMFRADHVGSLLRPQELLDARQSFQQKRISPERLGEIEDRCVLQALELQRSAGVEVFTDGEYRRSTFLDPLTRGIEGFVTLPQPNTEPAVLRWQGPNAALANATAAEALPNIVAGARLRRSGRLTGGEGAFLKQHAPGPWKMTMPGVTMRSNVMFRSGVSDKFYASVEELRQDLVSFYQAEVRDLLAEGVAYLQLDSLLYVGLARSGQDSIEARGAASRLMDEIVAIDNAIIDVAKAGGATVGLHMCRGNNRSSWLSAGSYEHLERAFNQLHADRFLLEYDSERSGGFEPLRFVPRDKMVVLGLISSKTPQLESVDALQRRIDEASKYLPAENLAISPQCGFASSAPGNLLGWDDMRRKLELVSETKRQVWG